MTWFNIQIHEAEAIASWHGELGTGEQSAEDFNKALGDARRVHLRIDSGGGDTCAAAKMFTELVRRETVAHVPRLCGSAALLGLMAARSVRVGPAARFLFHSPTMAALGDAPFLRHCADSVDKTVEKLAEIYAGRLRIGPSEIRALLSGGDHWIDARRAMEIGLADEIVLEVEPSPEIAPASQNEAAVLDDGSESLFYDLVAAMGPIRVRDRAAFQRNLGVLLCAQVSELPRSACAVSEAGSPASIGGRGAGRILFHPHQPLMTYGSNSTQHR